jgi:uncharacterized protein YkwD
MTLGAELIMHMVRKKERDQQMQMQQDEFELQKAVAGINAIRAVGYKFSDMKPDQLEAVFGPIEQVTGLSLPRGDDGKILTPAPTLDDWIDQSLVNQMQSIPGTTGAPTTGGAPATATPNPIGGAPTEKSEAQGIMAGFTPQALLNSAMRKKFGLPSAFDEQKWQFDQMWKGKKYDLDVIGVQQRQQGLNLQAQGVGIQAQGLGIRKQELDRKATADAEKATDRKSKATREQEKLDLAHQTYALNLGKAAREAYNQMLINPQLQTPDNLNQLNAMLAPYNQRVVKKNVGWGRDSIELVPLDANKPMKPLIPTQGGGTRSTVGRFQVEEVE